MKEILKAVRRYLKTADIFLLITCLISSGFGLVLVYSATLTTNSFRFVTVQGGAIIIGVLLFILFSLVDPDDIMSLWKFILAFNILFIGSLFIFGRGGESTGNNSWLILGPLSLQPAEIVKISFIVLLAKQMHASRENINHVIPMSLMVGHLGLMIGLIYASSDDMGMAIVYVFIFFFMLFASGVRYYWFIVFGGGIALFAPFFWTRVMTDAQRLRILAVYDPDLDPLGRGYHTIRSRITLGGGGLFGQGLFNGTQTQSVSGLPAKRTDFIFSVAGEELGLVGCAAILLLLTTIIIRCLYVATRAKNGAGSLICVGIAGMLIFQTFENIGMCVGIMPVIGLTLPFFSYGGSSIVTMFAAMGLVSGVYMRPVPSWLRDRE